MVSRFQTPAGMFFLTDLSSLVLPIELQKSISQQVVPVLKLSSAVVADPERMLPLLLSEPSVKNLILTLDDSTTQADPSSLPQLVSDWGVESVSNNYAAAHLTLFYNPFEELALKKKQIVAELYDYCQREKVPFFLKLVIFWMPEQVQLVSVFQELQLQAIEELRALADVFILQYPQEPLACATLTAELDVPWLAVSAATDYLLYKQEVRDALEGGAQGIVADTILWNDLLQAVQGQLGLDGESKANSAVETVIKTTIRDRCLELSRIIDEFAA